MVAADTAEEASAAEAVASEEVTAADLAEVPEARAREAFTEASIRTAEEDIITAEADAFPAWWECSWRPSS